MSVLLAGYSQVGNPPPREVVFQEAAQMALREEYAAIERKRLTGDLRQRSGQHISRVGNQKSKSSQSAEDETAALLDRKFGGS